MVNDDTLYSTACNKVKPVANNTVATEPNNEPILSPSIKEWWAQVTVAPLESKRIVFNKGSSKGFTGSIPNGGHCPPNSTVGVSALWKKAQNIATKNKASETINRITPKFSPFWTAKVWSPK